MGERSSTKQTTTCILFRAKTIDPLDTPTGTCLGWYPFSVVDIYILNDHRACRHERVNRDRQTREIKAVPRPEIVSPAAPTRLSDRGSRRLKGNARCCNMHVAHVCERLGWAQTPDRFQAVLSMKIRILHERETLHTCRYPVFSAIGLPFRATKSCSHPGSHRGKINTGLYIKRRLYSFK